MIGVLVELADRSEVPADKLRPAREILDATPPLPPAMVRLCLWAAQYYQHSLGDTFSWALPTCCARVSLPKFAWSVSGWRARAPAR